MRRPPQFLPPAFIQAFGLVVVTAITVFAIVSGDKAILLAVLGLAGTAVGLGGFYEKMRRDINKALDLENEPEPESESGS